MKMISRKEAIRLALGAVGAISFGGVSSAKANKKQSSARVRKASLSAGTDKGEWRTYGGGLNSQRYSPLDQIGAHNFGQMQPAFTFKPEEYSVTSDATFQATPLIVKGVMYVAAGAKRACFALDAKTGAVIWQYYLEEGQRGRAAPRIGGGHGVSYWTDGSEERILFVTIGYQLVCLDAKSGTVITAFGKDGIVDLKLDDDQVIPLDGAGRGNEIGLHATPLVVGDVIVVGAAHSAGTITKEHVKGYVRGFDVKTGKRLWIFHTVPKPNEFGYSTWGNSSADWTGNTGNWSQNSADPELGLVYLSIEEPTDDYYAGFRPGNNLFGDCIVAMDVKTGKRVWYYQTVHHDMWDRDNDCPAILCDLKVNGKTIKALCLFTKQAFVFVLDRTTGKPVWPIPEAPAPKGDVPGETYSPTQPMPNKPPPFDVQGMGVDDLIDFTPELRAEAIKLMSNYRMGPLFNPPCISQYPGPQGAILSPGGDGAGQWTGGCFDPETNMAYIFSNISPFAIGLVPGKPAETDLDYLQGAARAGGQVSARGVQDGDAIGSAPTAGAAPRPASASTGPTRMAVQGMPYMKPPYGRITAYDLNKGNIVWQVAHGETPDEVRNSPALAGMSIPRTGSTGKVGVLVTKTLVIAGDGTATTGPDGKTGAWLRAYDKATGLEKGSVWMPGRATGCPMTYMIDGKQYVAIGISDPQHGQKAQLAVFALPA